MQFMLDKEKLLFLIIMVPKWPDTMADTVIAKCVQKQVAKCLVPVPLLGLVWCIHPIVL